jgi:hypothetical protein
VRHSYFNLKIAHSNSEKENMGLTTYAGVSVRQSDVTIAKNYLSRNELEDLNRIVTMFLDHAEDMARQKTPMYMSDWAESLNEFLTFRKRDILQGHGKISNAEMERLALKEYSKFHTRRLNLAKQIDDDDSDISGLNKAVKLPE